jgi:uncharacterized protein (DUF4415 family)
MKKLTRNQASQIRVLQRMKDEEIDFTDIPLTRDWSKAVRGGFRKPASSSLTIRLDPDVVAWLKGPGKVYQKRINAMLRNVMER